MNDDNFHFLARDREYSPAALYFQDIDSIEYVRSDVPCIHRRIDSILTLIIEMDSREPIGFKVKGFRNFYLRLQRKCEESLGQEFIDVTKILSEALSMLGNTVFEQSRNRERQAYEEAIGISATDEVKLKRPAGLVS